MRSALYYAMMLLLGFAWYKYGQHLLRKGRRDKNGELTEGPVGPVGFLLAGGVACYLFFSVLRALASGEVSCLGKACATGQVYTLAANSGHYWASVFFLVWCVLGVGYALYVTLKIWLRP